MLAPELAGANSASTPNFAVTALPPQLADAVAAAQAVLTRYQTFADVMVATGESIPRCLSDEQRSYARLGSAEVNGDDVNALRDQLAAAQDRRAADVRKRRAASNELLELESELRSVRAAIDQARGAYASTIVADFNRRWSEACTQLAMLHAEARQISETLQCAVNCPAPYRATLHVASGQWQTQFIAALPQAPPQPAQLETVTGAFNRLADALGLLGAVKQAVDADSRHAALARVRAGMPARTEGVFQVTRAFIHWGIEYPVGALIDRSLFGDSALYKIELARNAHRIEIGVAEAA